MGSTESEKLADKGDMILLSIPHATVETTITSATVSVAEAMATAAAKGAEAANPSARRVSVATSDCLPLSPSI